MQRALPVAATAHAGAEPRAGIALDVAGMQHQGRCVPGCAEVPRHDTRGSAGHDGIADAAQCRGASAAHLEHEVVAVHRRQ